MSQSKTEDEVTEKRAVATFINVSVDLPTVSASAEDFGLDRDVTAQDIVEQLRSHGGGKMSTLSDWELIDEPRVFVHVQTQYSDGTQESTNEEWWS